MAAMEYAAVSLPSLNAAYTMYGMGGHSIRRRVWTGMAGPANGLPKSKPIKRELCHLMQRQHHKAPRRPVSVLRGAVGRNDSWFPESVIQKQQEGASQSGGKKSLSWTCVGLSLTYVDSN